MIMRIHETWSSRSKISRKHSNILLTKFTKQTMHFRVPDVSTPPHSVPSSSCFWFPRYFPTQAYLESWQASVMELLAKVVNGRKPLSFFAKKLHHKYLTGFLVFTAWKVSKYRVFLVCNFLYEDWIRRFTP